MLARGHIFISGLVQGVCYRWFVEKHAKTFKLTGWVRNLWDGRVEVLCEGEKGLIHDFIKELRIGPPHSDVKGAQVEWQEYTGEFNDFQIIF